MNTTISRKQFFLGDLEHNTQQESMTPRNSKQLPLRPPWAADNSAFLQTCTRCGDCIAHCPEKILGIGRGGYPQVDFSQGKCTFCGACVRNCQAGALLPDATDVRHKPWQLQASIGENCLALQRVVCGNCNEQCASEAIVFHLVHDRVLKPIVDGKKCTGCGACYRPCPTNAVSIVGAQP